MNGDPQILVEQVARLLHTGDRFEAAKLIAAFTPGHNAKRVASEAIALEYCYSLLQWCLDNDHYDWAAKMLWTESQFTSEPRCTQMIWSEIAANNALLFQGAASMSKSYGGGGWLLLDWVRDPKYTTCNITGPSEQHLKDNFFSHLVMLHREATLPLPGIIGDLFIGLDPRGRKSAIRGVVIPLGKKAAGRLQGVKRFPRKVPHPKFGPLSRLRFFIDEAEEVPSGLWKDVNNILSNFDGDVEGTKIMMAYNPRNPASMVAERAEFPGGWEQLKPDVDEVWTSSRGWRVVRLDAEKCENIVQGRTVFPGLQTIAGYNKIIQDAGGKETPAYWTMCRGLYPRSGTSYTVISTMILSKSKGEFIFGEEPINVGGADLALEGGDAAEFAWGRFGRAVGYRLPPSMDNPEGKTTYFEKDGRRVLRHALQVDGIEPLPPGDTVKMAMAVKAKAVALHIPPGNLMVDRTGNGAGVHDLLKELWSGEVRGVNYSESPTERKIVEQDSKKPTEEYDTVCSELWFALKKWLEYGFVRFMPGVLNETIVKELTSRQYAAGKLNKVESKPQYKARGNNSPNKADAITLLEHAAREASGAVPSALCDVASTAVGAIDKRAPVVYVVCITNKRDDLED